MKIAMLIPHDMSLAGGVAVHVERLAAELEERGHTIHVFGTRSVGYTFSHFVEAAAVTTFAFPGGGMGTLSTPYSEYRAEEVFRKTKYDILHIHDPFVPVIAWEWLLSAPVPKVVTFHTCWNDTSMYRHLQLGFRTLSDFFSQHVRGVIYVSRMAKDCWSPLSKRHVPQLIITNGIGRQYVPAPRKHPRNTIKLIFLGRLVPRKGALILLRAVSKLITRYPNLRLTIVGSGPELSETIKRAHELDLDRVVDFTGELRGGEKIRQLQNADIFCAPYKNEAFGMAILEAMACGVPVCGFWEAGYDVFLADYPERFGLFRKRKSAAELVQAISYLIERPELRARLSEIGRTIASHFDWKTVASDTEAFYKSILVKST